MSESVRPPTQETPPTLARRRVLLTAAAVTVAAVSLAPRSVAAQPSIPSTFYGTVSIDGSPVPAGTTVRAFIGAVDCTQGGPQSALIDGGVSVYTLMVAHESQIPGCGREGAAVTFQVAGRPAAQAGAWSTSISHLDLNVGQSSPVPLPTATPVPTLNPTQVAATATETARFTPLPAAALPTDDPFGKGPLPSSLASTPTPAAPSAGGRPLVVVLIGVLGALGLVGAVAGLILSRRREH